MEQRPGEEGMIALPHVTSQTPKKHICCLVTKATNRQHVNSESLVLTLSRNREFLVKMDET